ncbi:carotenoid oxygenase family protein [Anthocerotibacter panamensis]|uniref:carotenoid oxygenase family protein n=1 Tax=Anthocerotibacter panamensis TaxID=2857077 RepID=UPI001C401B46|nr:carotenoid oxygenase family protein [Anthocerotibacter panamensis]
MVQTSQTCSSWAQAFRQPASEFGPTALALVSGALPGGLRGSLYRNGPGRLERGGTRMGHWFDGDGAVLAVHFTGHGAQAVYRYVQTAGYLAEEQAGKILYGNYGMTPPGWLWERWQRGTKNVANTSVFALPDRLLALWEAGKPHALDLMTLQTLGTDDLEGHLASFPHRPFSAHPKRDPETGEVYNFGVGYGGRNGTLHLYRCDRTGRVLTRQALPLEGFPLVHDFALCGAYLVFCVNPVYLDPLPVVATLQSASEALRWQPQRGTRILVIDRATLCLVGQREAEPWFQWHFGNGYVAEEGALVLTLSRYRDFSTNQFLREVVTGRTHTPARCTFTQIRLDPATAKIREVVELLERPSEFPTVHPHQVGRPNRYTYLALHGAGVDISRELPHTVARYDHQQGTFTEANLGSGCYPVEPLFVPDPEDPRLGWVLTVVYDAQQDNSEVWIFDHDRLDEQPVCRLRLPEIVPPGFHGTWRQA